MATSQQSAYQKWYEQNKKQLSDRRKARYASDPAYRQRALDNKKNQVQRAQSERQPLPTQYVYNLTQLAQELGVSEWALRDWRNKGYYPTPHQHSRSLWFTEDQRGLMAKLAEHMAKESSRDKDNLDDMISFVHANWS